MKPTDKKNRRDPKENSAARSVPIDNPIEKAGKTPPEAELAATAPKSTAADAAIPANPEIGANPVAPIIPDSDAGGDPDITAETENSDALRQEQEKMERADPKNRKKSSVIWKSIGLLAIFAISIYILIALSRELDDTRNSLTFGQLCDKLGYLFWIVIIALFLVMLLLQTIKFAYMNKLSFGKVRFGLGLRVNLVGKFYDNITPMSTGGQPFQMYYLHKNGVKIGPATSIPTMNYVIQMYAWQLVSLIFLTVNGNVLQTAAANNATLITVMCWVGWGINMFAPLLLLSVAFAPKFAYGLFRGLIKIGKKLHIVKDYDASLKKAYASIDSYRRELIFMGKRIGHIICLMLLSAVEFLVLLSIPVILTHFIADTPLTFRNWADMATLYLYTLYAVTFLPTPGASGFAEVVSSLAFVGVASEGTLIWLLLFMRFFTYYIFIILGLCVTLYDLAANGIKRKLAKRRAGKTVGGKSPEPPDPGTTAPTDAET